MLILPISSELQFDIQSGLRAAFYMHYLWPHIVDGLSSLPSVDVEMSAAYIKQVISQKSLKDLITYCDSFECLPVDPDFLLLLGLKFHEFGSNDNGLLAQFFAVTGAQMAGRWVSQSTTPENMLAHVAAAIRKIKTERRALFRASVAHTISRFMEYDWRRFTAALANFLGEVSLKPLDTRQKPLYFYYPGLPSQPYHDLLAMPWVKKLIAQTEEIREEARLIYSRRKGFEPFLQLESSKALNSYVVSEAQDGGWNALFFYRHGLPRHDAMAACPITAAALESADLCKIPHQSPEVCFSVLSPHTELKPHHGVTNVRSVVHLPLWVPSGCTLHVGDTPPHSWRVGEAVAFDDTYLHSARNDSDFHRIILLMDCWNPALTLAEREAVSCVLSLSARLALAAKAVDQADNSPR